ncbi:MAG: RelA/SpoT family protein, partial [Janthinobacterium lividum]
MNPENLPSIDVGEPLLADARAFVAEHAGAALLESGESIADHAMGVASIVQQINVDPPALLAALLFPVVDRLVDPKRLLTDRFGEEVAGLVMSLRKLLDLGGMRMQLGGGQEGTRDAAAARRVQAEALRKLLLAFAQDVRVVIVLLAARLQTLRHHAATKTSPEAPIPQETLEIYAPLANRLGIWEIKWELEDLAFRFENAETYRRIAHLLDQKRAEREAFVARAIGRLEQELSSAGIVAEVSGRPKHIYSIWKKMRGKDLEFSELYDVRAFRVIVEEVKDCYTVLGLVHHIWQPIPREFDDYISRPKANGYRSLHTVVIGDDGAAFEVQIRTQEMHRFAEYGVAAHWRYKEAGTRGYSGQVTADAAYDERIAWLRQLLAWKDDVARNELDSEGDGAAQPWEQLRQAPIDDHIYVLTPQARIIELPQGATPIDFAYHVHTELGHRCRGARVDGTMVPLNRPLANGQTVEIVAVKQGGPSRDWLNQQLGYLQSPRARLKVRAWFNAIELNESIATGRALVEKTLQREGKTSIGLDDLATRLGFKTPEELFALVGKDEFSLRHVEQALGGTAPETVAEATPLIPRQASGASVARGAASGVLVVGVGALMTQFARCCRPAPPDDITGFVTRGKGVSIHRSNCPS